MKKKYKNKSSLLNIFSIFFGLLFIYLMKIQIENPNMIKQYTRKSYLLLVIVFIIIITIKIINFIINKIRRKNKHNAYLNSGITQVDTMTGIEFERFLEVHFKKMEYIVKKTPKSYDFGADHILEKNGEITIIQAKRYKGNVGLKAVQEVIGAKGFYKADRASIYITSKFTSSAIKLAKANGVELVDRSKLIEIMNSNTGHSLAKEVIKDTLESKICPECKGKLEEKSGKFGYFIGCSNYPKCNFTR